MSADGVWRVSSRGVGVGGWGGRRKAETLTWSWREEKGTRANQSRSIIRVTTTSQGNLPLSWLLKAAVKHTFNHKLKHLNFTIYGMFEESPTLRGAFVLTYVPSNHSRRQSSLRLTVGRKRLRARRHHLVIPWNDLHGLHFLCSVCRSTWCAETRRTGTRDSSPDPANDEGQLPLRLLF